MTPDCGRPAPKKYGPLRLPCALKIWPYLFCICQYNLIRTGYHAKKSKLYLVTIDKESEVLTSKENFDQKGEVVFRSRSKSKTHNLMFLAGEASYRPKKHLTRNEFRRRRCQYPFLLGQIFENSQFLKKKSESIFCFRKTSDQKG